MRDIKVIILATLFFLVANGLQGQTTSKTANHDTVQSYTASSFLFMNDSVRIKYFLEADSSGNFPPARAGRVQLIPKGGHWYIQTLAKRTMLDSTGFVDTSSVQFNNDTLSWDETRTSSDSRTHRWTAHQRLASGRNLIFSNSTNALHNTITMSDSSLYFALKTDSTGSAGTNKMKMNPAGIFLYAPLTIDEGYSGSVGLSNSASNELTVNASSGMKTQSLSLTGSPLPATSGGTGFASYTAGDMLYASSTTAMSKLNVGANGTVLVGGTTPAYSTSPKLSGYARIGSTSTPTNTSNGDLTASRLDVGSNSAFGATNGYIAHLGQTLTDVASGATLGVNVQNTITTASKSSSDFRVFNCENQISSSCDTLATVRSFYGINRFNGTKGVTSLMVACDFVGFLRGGGQTTPFQIITAVYGVRGQALNQFSDTTHGGTVTSAYAFEALQPVKTNATISTSVGYRTDNNTAGTNNTNFCVGTPTTGNWNIYGNSVYDNYLNGNLGIHTTAFGTSAAGIIAIGNGTAPTASITDGVQLYSADAAAGDATLFARDEAGNVTRLTGRIKRVSSQFDKTNTTLANITGLTFNVEGAKSYSFHAVLFVDASAGGGHKYAMSGTATAMSILYHVRSINDSTKSNMISSRLTALDASAGQAGAVTVYTDIEGTITVNAAGTLTIQFAQNTSSGTSSVLAGSYFELK